jgi:hypothetical protein
MISPSSTTFLKNNLSRSVLLLNNEDINISNLSNEDNNYYFLGVIASEFYLDNQDNLSNDMIELSNGPKISFFLKDIITETLSKLNNTIKEIFNNHHLLIKYSFLNNYSTTNAIYYSNTDIKICDFKIEPVGIKIIQKNNSGKDIWGNCVNIKGNIYAIKLKELYNKDKINLNNQNDTLNLLDEHLTMNFLKYDILKAPFINHFDFNKRENYNFFNRWIKERWNEYNNCSTAYYPYKDCYEEKDVVFNQLKLMFPDIDSDRFIVPEQIDNLTAIEFIKNFNNSMNRRTNFKISQDKYWALRKEAENSNIDPNLAINYIKENRIKAPFEENVDFNNNSKDFSDWLDARVKTIGSIQKKILQSNSDDCSQDKIQADLFNQQKQQIQLMFPDIENETFQISNQIQGDNRIRVSLLNTFIKLYYFRLNQLSRSQNCKQNAGKSASKKSKKIYKKKKQTRKKQKKINF